MDLISRKALIESMGLENAVKWGNKDGYQQANSYSTMMRYEIKDSIDCQPSVPAVPLDKLCEWLERYATMNCDGCREAFGSCEDTEPSVCNSRERWKAMLTKWMEGLEDG